MGRVLGRGFSSHGIYAIILEQPNANAFSKGKYRIVHACGHDAHIAILLGLASVPAKISVVNTPNLLLIFQNAEESYPSGAPEVIKGLPRYAELCFINV